MDWSKPKEATMLDVAFGSGVIGKFLPPMEEIPKAYHRGSRPGCEVGSRIFFSGAKQFRAEPREGVDAVKAMQQIRACLGSFDPQHEHKTAGVGYLFELFFSAVELDGKRYEFTIAEDK
jgi:hypothetical protein